ncbi:TauD/TfdA family dioxygenase [Gemmatimonas sp.]
MLSQELDEAGFAFIPRLAPESSTDVVIASLGSVVALPGTTQVQVLRPREKSDAPPNIYSGQFGKSEFPMHTDLAHWYVPPRYFVLRCIVGAPEVATRLVDGRKIFEHFGIDTLYRTLLQPRRPSNGSRPLLRMLIPSVVGEHQFRWDSLFVRPATLSSSKTFHAVSDLIDAQIESQIYLTNPGDTLVVDNWRMLHGRTAVPPTAGSRHIERAYMQSLAAD